MPDIRGSTASPPAGASRWLIACRTNADVRRGTVLQGHARLADGGQGPSKYTQSVVRALVVDDSTAVRRRLLALLQEHAGLELYEASDAEAAFEVLTSTCIDVIVLDMRLGKTSGLDMIQRIKALLPKSTIVVLTNHANPALQRKCLERGADYFFDKSRQFQAAVDVVAGQLRGA